MKQLLLFNEKLAVGDAIRCTHPLRDSLGSLVASTSTMGVVVSLWKWPSGTAYVQFPKGKAYCHKTQLKIL